MDAGGSSSSSNLCSNIAGSSTTSNDPILDLAIYYVLHSNSNDRYGQDLTTEKKRAVRKRAAKLGIVERGEVYFMKRNKKVC